MHRYLKINLLLSIMVVLFFSTPSFSQPQVISYLCEIGIRFYNQAKYEQALQEFNNVLVLDPHNSLALDYIERINLKKDMVQENILSKTNIKEQVRQINRDRAIESNLDKYEARQEMRREQLISSSPAPPKRDPKELPEDFIAETVKKINDGIEPFKLSGEIVLGFGTTSDKFIWKQANGDLNERNWRIAFGDLKENTYDKRIFERLRLNLDKEVKEGLGFHTNITIDPWSFTAKSDKFTITGAGGDAVELELKYWSNTHSTINEIFFTLFSGDSFALPEIKVVDGYTVPTTVTSLFGNTFTIPQVKLRRSFQPVRELWFDYVKDDMRLRFFPIAYQDQALTSDDPLGFSNHHIYWEESPWLDEWKPGNLNTAAVPVDFTKGEWNDDLSFFTRDSDNLRLTALRGFSLQMSPQEATSFYLTLASPKDLWQEYDEFNSQKTAARIKHYVNDHLFLGGIYTGRLGFNKNQLDAQNHLIAADLSFTFWEGFKIQAELSRSNSSQDKSSLDYKTRKRGNAFYFSLIGTNSKEDILDLNYFAIKPKKAEGNFLKGRFYFAHMDKGFEPPLATYRQTRDDAFWSRHLHFRRPFDYYYTGLVTPLKWEDVQVFAIGDGIDIGRDVVGLRLESSLWEQRFDNLFTLRNVHKTDGKYIETEVRDEITLKLTDKLTAKFLGLYQDLPKTKGGIDPFIFDPDTGDYFLNPAMPDGEDPSLRTGSIGVEYNFTEWLALNGIYEITNDYTLAYDNFPRGLLSDSTFTTYTEYDRVFRQQQLFLYNQGLFPLPPYKTYNIFKLGLRLIPLEHLEIYLDFTRNEFQSAGQISDDMNHIGFEIGYLPLKRLGFYLKYTYSRWNDLVTMNNAGSDYYDGHHNIFMEMRYLPSKDSELVMQYGEGGVTPLSIVNFDPFGGATMTLDTQHIFRMFYKKKF